MPKRVCHAHGYLKKAAAPVNAAAGRLPLWKAHAIFRAADETIAGKVDEEGLTLKEAALRSGEIDEKRFDEIVNPEKTVGHGVAGS
jgi:fumarate hydratase class II